MMKYSYIVPTYNRKDKLVDTLNSILNQSRNDYEIIVIDDGSSDGTEYIDFHRMSEKIRYFQRSNSGVSSARNYGASLAKGSYLIFLDSDDLISGEQLKVFDSLIRENENHDMFFTSYSFWESSSGHLIKRKELKDGKYDDFLLDCTRSIQPFFPGCLCLSKLLFEQSNKFKEGCNFGEDQALWVELLSSHEAVSSNTSTLWYRVDSLGSLSKAKIKKLPPDIYVAIDKGKSLEDNRKINRYIKHRLKSFTKIAIKDVNVRLLSEIFISYLKSFKV